MILVGIHGAIGAGKDVVAAWLCRHHGFVRIGMADALKDEVVEKFPRTLRAIMRLHSDSWSEPEVDLCRVVHELKPPGVRELLQEMGTGVRRADDPDYWVKKLAGRLVDMPATARVVVPDVRFRNEALLIQRFSGTLVKVVRPGHDPADAAHASETSLLDWAAWDAVIRNDSTVAELERKAEALALTIL